MTAGFAEHRVEADGFSIRYLEAGTGPTLCCLHGAGGLRLSRAHELLAGSHRVVAFEAPGFGDSPVNDTSATLADLAATIRRAIEALGIDRTSLWGTSFGAKLALHVAIQDPGRIDALVLASPAAIRPEPAELPDPADMGRYLFAHPERQPPAEPVPADVATKQQALVARLFGPPRDPDLETGMARLDVPTLVLFGSRDRITPADLGRHYRRILPSCQVVIVYDAAHAVDADRPEAFAATVADFVARGDQFVVRQESGLRYP